MRPVHALSLFAAIVLGGCPSERPVLPEGGDPFADPDPDVVHVRLVAEEVEWRLGDGVVVELVNRLPEATTIHWHGLRVPAGMMADFDVIR